MATPPILHIDLTAAPIDVGAVLAAVQSPRAGAAVLFLGTTREFTGPRQTVRLVYEAYADMARQELPAADEARAAVAAGRLRDGAPARPRSRSARRAWRSPSVRRIAQAAFEAGQWLIDRIKQIVPIWKKEAWADGSTEWVHPGLASAETPTAATPEDAT